MTVFPLLPLANIQLDSALARRLPKRLAYYHLALPIAQDDEQITVAMAAPDRHAVVRMLETVLGMPVVPVRAHAHEISQLLDQIWSEETDVRTSGILSWTLEPIENSSLSEYTYLVAGLLNAPYLNEHASLMSFDQLLEQAHSLQPLLLVTDVRDAALLTQLLKQLTCSLLILPDEPTQPRRILHVVRGNTADRVALNWIVPIAQACQSTVTLFTAAGAATDPSSVSNPLENPMIRLLDSISLSPLAECGQVLSSLNVPGRIKVKHGTLEGTVKEELSREPTYDLIVVTVESYGGFALHMLEHMRRRCAVLVVKP